MLKGFADVHNHQFANLGFGGLAFWGAADGEVEQALPWCTPAHGPGGMGDILGNFIAASYGGPGGLGHKVGGNPQFDGWPRWNSVSHQAVYEDWLYRAVQGGLRLLVMLAVNNEAFCSKANKAPGRSCDDMEAVDLQLAAAKEMEAHIDAKSGGPGLGWYRIVRTPQEAREVISSGKLAVVLGIEVDYLFGCRSENDLDTNSLRAALDRYFALGVRHFFPIHFDNNGFGGVAFQNELDRDASGGIDLNPTRVYSITTEDGTAEGYSYRGGRKNISGLTALGKTLVNELMKRGMLVDVDHMSFRSRSDALDIAEQRKCPVISSHVGFVEISTNDKRHEGNMVPGEVERIRAVGGIMAPIVHQGNLDQIVTWENAGQTTVTHGCGNTSETWVQAYLYAVAKSGGAPVGIGTDMNGFAGLPGPRFGAESCPGGTSGGGSTKPQLDYPFLARATGAQMDRSVVGDKTFDYNTDGLAHVGMLPDLIADLERLGLTEAELAPLLASAEGYVQVWERVWNQRISPTDPFVPVLDGLGDGIGGYDLRDPADEAFAFDYDGSGKLDHLALYRPGTGTIWILKQSGGAFSPVYAEGSPGNGIGGYDLGDPTDRAFAFDYDGSGKLDHLALYRPGIGIFSILKKRYPPPPPIPPAPRLDVSVQPYPVPPAHPVSVTVFASDADTHAAVQAKVLIDRVLVGSTGTPFQHTFRAHKTTGPKGEPPDIVWPIGTVVAGGLIPMRTSISDLAKSGPQSLDGGTSSTDGPSGRATEALEAGLR
jgi:microsomal dipeptidase-like Zn-dependent dipeptidase